MPNSLMDVELKNRVVSFEIAQRLKALGVPQEADYSWMYIDGEWDIYWHQSQAFGQLTQFQWEKAVRDSFAAFTVDELIYLLGNKFGVLERFHGGGFGAYIPNDCGVNGIADSPADALALLLEGVFEVELTDANADQGA